MDEYELGLDSSSSSTYGVGGPHALDHTLSQSDCLAKRKEEAAKYPISSFNCLETKPQTRLTPTPPPSQGSRHSFDLTGEYAVLHKSSPRSLEDTPNRITHRRRRYSEATVDPMAHSARTPTIPKMFDDAVNSASARVGSMPSTTSDFSKGPPPLRRSLGVQVAPTPMQGGRSTSVGSSSGSYNDYHGFLMPTPPPDSNRGSMGGTPTFRMHTSLLDGNSNESATIPMTALVNKRNNADNFDYGLDALGIPVDQLRESKNDSLPEAFSSVRLEDTARPVGIINGRIHDGGENCSLGSSSKTNGTDFLPSISPSKSRENSNTSIARMPATVLERPISTILAHQRWSGTGSSSVTYLGEESEELSLNSSLNENISDRSPDSPGKGTYRRGSDEFPLVTSMDSNNAVAGSRLFSMLVANNGSGFANPAVSTLFDDELLRDLNYCKSTGSNATTSVPSHSASSPMFTALFSNEGAEVHFAEKCPKGVSRWILPPAKEFWSMYGGTPRACVGNGDGDQDADMESWEQVDTVTIIEHKGTSASKHAMVTANGHHITVSEGRTEGDCETDECVLRRVGTTAMPSVLVNDACARFVRHGENAFVLMLDRSQKGRATNMSVDPAREVGSAVVRAYLKHAAECKEATMQLKVSLLYCVEGGGCMDLVSGTAKDDGVRPLEVASSPIIGHCVDGCQWLLVDDASDLDELMKGLVGRVGGKTRGILLAQFLFQSCLPPPPTSHFQRGDVVISSFTFACSPFTDLYEAILNQRPETQWRLFRFALCKGPSAVIVIACVDEKDTEAAYPLSILQRMKTVPHPRPRRGSVAEYITKQREQAANLEWRKGFAGGDSKRFDILLSKIKANTDDAVAFLKNPMKVPVPLYMESRKRAVSYCICRARDYLKSRKLQACHPEIIAVLHQGAAPAAASTAVSPSNSGLTSRTSTPKGLRLVADGTSLTVHTGAAPSKMTSKVYRLGEVCTWRNGKQLSSTILDGLAELFLSGFNTNVLTMCPKADPGGSRGTKTSGGCRAPGSEDSMPVMTNVLCSAAKKALSGSSATAGKKTLSVTMSFFYIDNNRCVDLLQVPPTKGDTTSPLTRAELDISPVLGCLPHGCTRQTLKSSEEVDALVQKGLRALSACARQADVEDGGKHTSFSALTVELKQLTAKKDDTVISRMTGVSLGDQYHIVHKSTADRSPYSRASMQSLALLFLYGLIAGPAVSVGAAVLDKRCPTADTNNFLHALTGLPAIHTSQPIPLGTLTGLIDRLQRIRDRLRQSGGGGGGDGDDDDDGGARGRTAACESEDLARIDGMMADARGLLKEPQTRDVPYYPRWDGDVEELEVSSLNLGAESTGEHSLVDVDQEEPTAGAQAQNRYYGVCYQKDVLRRTGGGGRTEAERVPSIAIVSTNEMGNVVRTSSSTEVEVPQMKNEDGVPNGRFTFSEVVEITPSTQGLKSSTLARAVSCVVSGRNAALVAFDTSSAEVLTSISWLTLRTSINRLFTSLSSSPFSITLRMVLLEEGKEDVMTDLLSGNDASPNTRAVSHKLKVSPLCGPVVADVIAVPVHTAAEVDAALGAASLMAAQIQRESPFDELHGAIAVQLIVHQAPRKGRRGRPWTEGWATDVRRSKGPRKDKESNDILLSSFWCICVTGGAAAWLRPPASVTAALPERPVPALLRYIFTGPCFTTAIVGLSGFPSNSSLASKLVLLRQLFSQIGMIHESKLREPRYGSVELYEDYLEKLSQSRKQHQRVQSSPGTDGAVSLSALLLEVRVLLQHRKDIGLPELGKPLSTLSHEAKLFSVLEESEEAAK